MKFRLLPRSQRHRIQDAVGTFVKPHREASRPDAGEASNNGHVKLHTDPICALSDPELIERVAAGDEAGTTILFERYSDYVFSIAAAILRDREEAQDVVQETFCELWRTAKRFDPSKGSFPAWVYLLASHRALKRKHQLRAQPSYQGLPIEDSGPEFLNWNNEFSLAPQEQTFLLNELLKTLKPAQSRATVLKFFEGLTAEQGANRTGESSSSFENHVYRGLKKLREIIRKNE